MKLIYSHLQKFLPDLNVEPQKLRDDLTMIGHFCNYFDIITSAPLVKEGIGEIDYVFDLDIKVNRGDCLGYYGLAKDLSILYNLPLSDLTANFQFPSSPYSLPIKVETSNAIRVMAVKITGLKNKPSPNWLKTFLKLHDQNSINTLVDLTNYVMFMYGIPNHAFDTAKSTDNLIWQMNPGYSEFTSLDDTVFKIDRSILMVNNPQTVLSLSFWGGKACAIDESTTSTIIEMAIYNPTVVRQNSRLLKATTEAAVRLEKALDPNSIPAALSYLAQLIIDNCGGQVDSQLFDHYPRPETPTPIDFDPTLPSKMSGIDIPVDFATKIVAQVGHRPDLNLPEDLVEEVVRFYGYQHIPTSEPLAFKQVPNITPKILFLIDQLKDQLIAEGYDEVITWPLVNQSESARTIQTQNSINSEYIYLRQSLIPSLKLQLDQYQRFKLPQPKFFEIGKIYYQANHQYVEKYVLAKYDGQDFSETILDDLEKPDSYLPKIISNDAVELTSQIIALDANLTAKNANPIDLLKKYISLIDPKILWALEIIDIYQDRYTFRAYYYNTDDKTAKKVHLSAFNLLS